MALTFSVIETTKTPLWDFGWFDLTRFKVEGPVAERQDSTCLLGAFVRDPISQRSFCGPGGWGDPVERHGPFLHRNFVAEWFRPIPAEKLRERIQITLNGPEFTECPNAGQREPVEAWAAAVRARGDDVFALETPDRAEGKVDWDWVWIVYQEFASVSRDREGLAIGVIGYD